MKYLYMIIILAVANSALAWNSIEEMESGICFAMSNKVELMSSTFSNKLEKAISSNSSEMKTEAYIVKSIIAYSKFLESSDDMWLTQELCNATNAVRVIGDSCDKWQYWMARFMYANAQISLNRFSDSHCTLTNALCRIVAEGYTNEPTRVEALILKKYEMPDLRIVDAMKVFAAMTAVQLKMGSVATNYANQVPVKYKEQIIEFMR